MDEKQLATMYDELRAIARGRMSMEAADHTLQPTALVHEAWMRIQAIDASEFKDRTHS